MKAIPKLIAIIGSSGSGKSALALELAKEIDAEIFSLDSLSIYQSINILSAKPSQEELKQIKHYGIDILNPTQHSSAIIFKKLLLNAISECKKDFLLIVGGSSFFLKAILEGLSPMPDFHPSTLTQIQTLHSPYQTLTQIDPEYAKNIKPQDSYRITKALQIFLSTNLPPSLYFKKNPPLPFPYPIDIFCIDIDREILRQKIIQRTHFMLENGGIQEMQNLLKKYPKTCQPFKAIGPKEVIEFLEEKITFQELSTQITTHTMQLAKRQKTFNKTQFKNSVFLEKNHLFDTILSHYKA